MYGSGSTRQAFRVCALEIRVGGCSRGSLVYDLGAAAFFKGSVRFLRIVR